MTALAELEGGDVFSLRVSDEAGVAEAFRDVEQGELGPGVGRSRRMRRRASSGHPASGMRSVSSTTQAPSRTEPSVSMAWTQSSSWIRSMAPRTPWSMGNPMEKSSWRR